VPQLAEIITALDLWYPPSTAESWDAIGLTCGDLDADVTRIVLAVDCVPATVAEAVTCGAQLLITHHPLLLTGVHGVPTTDPKGALVHRMIQHGVAHFVAHTNADIARDGVSEALASRVGLLDVHPLLPIAEPPMDQLTVFVPPPELDALVAAMSAAGAGRVGRYQDCTFTVQGTGSYRPLPGAQPAAGEMGELSRVSETRLSMVMPRGRREEVLTAMRTAHPYEEVAFELTERPNLAALAGTGRIGQLATQMTLSDFTHLVATRLPRTQWGVRAAGDPRRTIERVAVCGGSGGPYVDLARNAGAHAFLTSDLKHHNTVEAVTERPGTPMALIDAAHYATEAPWLGLLAGQLTELFGDAVQVTASTTVTDPWTVHAH
jgi:dinuclear metal center YbgI/SA1388 family protein